MRADVPAHYASALEPLRSAFDEVTRPSEKDDLIRVQAAAASELGEEHALIFGAHLLLLHGSMLLSNIDIGLKGGKAVAVAVDEALSPQPRAWSPARNRNLGRI